MVWWKGGTGVCNHTPGQSGYSHGGRAREGGRVDGKVRRGEEGRGEWEMRRGWACLLFARQAALLGVIVAMVEAWSG